MMDKLETRVPFAVPFSRGFESLMRETRHTEVDPFRPSQHYGAVADLREFGIDAIFHMSCKHGEQPDRGNHKIELLETGVKGYSEMLGEMEKIFDADPRRFEVMRVDMTADVKGVPVPWFQENARAKFKRWGCEHGQYSQMGTRGIQTVYLGKRPNCIRIYDKVAQLKSQYEKDIRSHQKYLSPTQSAKRLLKRELGIETVTTPPSFEEVYGYPEGYVLTRVERQIGAGRVPERIGIVAKLKRAPRFNPFENIEFSKSGIAQPDRYRYSLSKYCAGMYLRQLKQQLGPQFNNWVRETEGRNTDRFLDSFADFLPPSEDGISSERLYEIYQDSVSKQLAA